MPRFQLWTRLVDCVMLVLFTLGLGAQVVGASDLFHYPIDKWLLFGGGLTVLVTGIYFLVGTFVLHQRNGDGR